jgi:hypothetical protein
MASAIASATRTARTLSRGSTRRRLTMRGRALGRQCRLLLSQKARVRTCLPLARCSLVPSPRSRSRARCGRTIAPARIRSSRHPGRGDRSRRERIAPRRPPGRSLSFSRDRASDDRKGDDARVRSRSPTAGADLRFARPAGAVATFEINGSRSSAPRVSSERHRRRLGRSLLAHCATGVHSPPSAYRYASCLCRACRPAGLGALPRVVQGGSGSTFAGSARTAR